jgi:hypothetical protein
VVEARPAADRLWRQLRRPGVDAFLGLGIFATAFAVRLSGVLLGGGLGYFGRYDDGVYYAAADALTFGRIPYRNFVLLHPPGTLLVLAPFALIGRATHDALGMTLARLAYMAIGALNAVLVAQLARRWGRAPGVLAGLLYAGFAGAVYSEQATYLEPLGGTALLVALLLLLRRENPSTRRDEIISGVVLGLACTLKIWYVAPWLAIAGYFLTIRRFPTARRILVAGAAAILVVLLPFFLMAPGQMWRMVVRDQLRRQDIKAGLTGRLKVILGTDRLLMQHPAALHVMTALVLLLLVAAAIGCWRHHSARLILVVLVVNLGVLYASPSFYGHYSALTAAPLALVLVIGLSNLLGSRRVTPTMRRAVGFLAIAVVLASGIRLLVKPTGARFPGARFDQAAPAGCITADDPQALIQMNRLSQDFREGCPVPVDVTGITYDSLRRTQPDGRIVHRSDNDAFQRYLSNYLESGAAFVVIRRRLDDSPLAMRVRLAQQPPIITLGGITLRRGRG